MSSNLDLKGLGAFNSEKEAYEALKREGGKLIRIASKQWREYLRHSDSVNSERKGRRTGNSLRSLEFKMTPRKDGATGIMVEVTFKNNLAWHNSIVGGQKGHSIALISMGWHSRKLENKIGKRYWFTQYDGYGYLSKIFREYDKVKDPRISLELEMSDNLKGKRPIK